MVLPEGIPVWQENSSWNPAYRFPEAALMQVITRPEHQGSKGLLQILSGIKVIQAFRAQDGEATSFSRENLRYFRPNGEPDVPAESLGDWV